MAVHADTVISNYDLASGMVWHGMVCVAVKIKIFFSHVLWLSDSKNVHLICWEWLLQPAMLT